MLPVVKKEVPLMPETQDTTSHSCDPFEPFRGLRDAYLDAMAKSMVEAVNTEAYAQATGTMLEGCLTAVAPFREALEKSMLQTLQHLELPSRQELAALAERFTSIEMRLDDMDAKLDVLVRAVAASMPEEPPGYVAKPAPTANKPAAQSSPTPPRNSRRPRASAHRQTSKPQR